MRVVCPQDVEKKRLKQASMVYLEVVVCTQDMKKMLLKHAKIFYWKKWATKHECEEFKEGNLLEPNQGILR